MCSHRDKAASDENACFLLEVAGQQIGYFRRRENAERAALALVNVYELRPPEPVACEDDDPAPVAT
jgi:hypothetical protein